jgi:predicted MFS family arabinose efflux permease
MNAISSTPGARRLLFISIVARLPLTMLSIGLLVHAEHISGSFAAAGVVAAAYAVSLGVGGPLLGALVDRRGQTSVLVGSALAAAVVLVALALLPVGTPLPVVVALTLLAGFATPPVGASVRALFPELLDDADVRAAYAVDASAVELTWIAGPPLALGLGVAWSTGGALVAAAVVVLLGTAAFAAQPVSRAWRPRPVTHPRRGGALQAPAVRTLVLALVAVGTLFGAVEVAVAAATEAGGSSAAVGPLLGIWGAGSLLGGLLAARAGGGAQSAAGLTLVLGALTVGHFALVPAAGSVLAMAAVLLVAGAAIAPAYASIYAMVERGAPEGTVTEAFSWLATAAAIGTSLGAAAAGVLADGPGPEASFLLAAGAGAVATLILMLRAGTLGTGVPCPQPART